MHVGLMRMWVSAIMLYMRVNDGVGERLGFSYVGIAELFGFSHVGKDYVSTISVKIGFRSSNSLV